MALLVWMEDFKKDLVHALRSLRADPLFTTVAILALAIGIGANTAIFSVMNAVVLRLLPIHEPQRVFNLACDGQPNGASNTGDTEAVRIGTVPEEAASEMVSGNYFSGLGVRAECGRLLSAADEAEHTQAAVLSHRFWSRYLIMTATRSGAPFPSRV